MPAHPLRLAVVDGVAPPGPGAEVVTVPTLEAALDASADAVLLPAAEARRLAASLAGAHEAAKSEIRHDVSNDLTAVLGFAQLLLQRRAELPPVAVARVQRIFEHASAMAVKLRKETPASPERPADGDPPTA